MAIVCSGRIEPSKGQIYLIDACGQLKQRHLPFRLLLAGDAANEAYTAACLRKASELGIKEQVELLGHVDNVAELLLRADLFVLPSVSGEAFSRAIIEAMAMGRPVVATDVGGAKEAIEDGVSGFVVPPCDPAALAERILILARDEELRLGLGAAARKRVEERFTIERNIQSTERIYAELLGETGA